MSKELVGDLQTGILQLSGLDAPMSEPGQGEAQNRTGSDLLGAGSDMDAVRAWLAKHEGSSNTHRAYYKEAERFLLWCHAYGKTISGLNHSDCLEYASFLLKPEPRQVWCGPKRRRFIMSKVAQKLLNDPEPTPALSSRDRELLRQAIAAGRENIRNPQWRPFEKPLTGPTARRAVGVIRALFDFLVTKDYLRANPVSGVESQLANRGLRDRAAASGGTLTPTRKSPRSKALSAEAIKTLFSLVEAMPRESEQDRFYYHRARLLLALFYYLGPRVSELITHGMGSFEATEANGWYWNVSGKARGETEVDAVPVADALIRELKLYRTAMGLKPLPDPGEKVPLVARRDGKPMTDRQAYNIVTALFRKAADRLEESGNLTEAGKLRRASPHWLRHTAITHVGDKSRDPRLTQMFARHQSQDTTMTYFNKEDRERFASVNMLPSFPVGAEED